MKALRNLLPHSRRIVASIEIPAGERLGHRIQRFAGTIRSRAPITDLKVFLNGIERAVELKQKPAATRFGFKTMWEFWAEVAESGACGSTTLEVATGERLILQQTFREVSFDDRCSPLVFLQHIPKTAGTSLRAALEQHSSIRLLGIYPDPAFLKSQDVEALSGAAFDDVDVVFGHFYHGLHRHTRRRYLYVTILRHPADLIRSYYLFMKYQTGAFAGYQTIEQAFTNNFPAFDNVITRFIAGVSPNTPIGGDIFIKAKENLAHDYAFVGLTEQMSASTEVIGRLLGVKLDELVTNVTPPTAEAEELDRGWIMDRFAPHLQFDMQIYEEASQRFGDASCIARL